MSDSSPDIHEEEINEINDMTTDNNKVAILLHGMINNDINMSLKHIKIFSENFKNIIYLTYDIFLNENIYKELSKYCKVIIIDTKKTVLNENCYIYDKKNEFYVNKQSFCFNPDVDEKDPTNLRKRILFQINSSNILIDACKREFPDVMYYYKCRIDMFIINIHEKIALWRKYCNDKNGNFFKGRLVMFQNGSYGCQRSFKLFSEHKDKFFNNGKLMKISGKKDAFEKMVPFYFRDYFMFGFKEDVEKYYSFAKKTTIKIEKGIPEQYLNVELFFQYLKDVRFDKKYFLVQGGYFRHNYPFDNNKLIKILGLFEKYFIFDSDLTYYWIRRNEMNECYLSFERLMLIRFKIQDILDIEIQNSNTLFIEKNSFHICHLSCFKSKYPNIKFPLDFKSLDLKTIVFPCLLKVC